MITLIILFYIRQAQRLRYSLSGIPYKKTKLSKWSENISDKIDNILDKLVDKNVG